MRNHFTVLLGRCSKSYLPKLFKRSAQYDLTQMSYLNEKLILVDQTDVPIGEATKQQCHTWSDIVQNKYLHRAFSVFLFNEENKLLLQKRSAAKITFPYYWTNTCCSHPSNDPTENSTAPDVQGIITAAQRKMKHELGVSPSDLLFTDYQMVNRILYKAQSDENWGEYELDYVLIAKHNQPTLNLNQNEVETVKYVDQHELKRLMESNRCNFTPWFNLIFDHFLTDWWNLVITDQSIIFDPKIHILDK